MVRFVALLFAGLVACQVPANKVMPEVTPTGEWVEFPPAAPVSYDVRFRGQAPVELSPDQITELNGRCPRIRRMTAVKDSEAFWIVSVEGDGLDHVEKVGAVFEEVKRADAQHRLDGSTMVMPVACSECTLLLGVRLKSGPLAACTGPGFSVWMKDGVAMAPTP